MDLTDDEGGTHSYLLDLLTFDMFDVIFDMFDLIFDLFFVDLLPV